MSEALDCKRILGFPVVITDAVAEGETLCGSFPPPERENMSLEEYAEQCVKYFTKIKLKADRAKN